MKFTKIIALILAAITAMTMFVACNEGGDETPALDGPQESQPRHKALVHVKVVNYNGKEVYSTLEEDEPYEYDSAYYEPYVFTFLEDFAFMNYKEFAYKADKYDTGTDEEGNKITTYVLKSISITQRKKTKEYKADEEIKSLYDESMQKTYWVCFVNGVEINMNDTILKDGDIVEFRLAYKDSDKVTTKEETFPEMNNGAETPAASK